VDLKTGPDVMERRKISYPSQESYSASSVGPIAYSLY
jgi:hypothetical protein